MKSFGNHWCYGFVEQTQSVKVGEEYKVLILAEIYFKKNKPFAYVPVDTDDLSTDEEYLALLINDLTAALSEPRIFKESEFNGKDA